MVAFLFIMTIVTFIVVDLVRTRRAERRAAEGDLVSVPRAAGVLLPLRIPGLDRYAAPAGVFLHRGHTWAHLDETGRAKIGIDDFARGIVGKLDRVETPPAGAHVAQGEKILSALKGCDRIDFVSPLGGIVREVNDETAADPRSGWLLSLEPTDLAKDLKRLRIASEAARWLEGEKRRFAEFLSACAQTHCAVGATLQDGGLHVEGIYEKLDEESRRAFEKSFLA